MTKVEDFIFQFEGNQREVMLYLHNLLAGQLNLTAKMRYKIPFYYKKSWICYMNPTKDSKVEFAFVRGNELSNEQGLLFNKGRKQVYSVELAKTSEIPYTAINEIIHEAILLDEIKTYTSKRKSE